MKSIAGFLIIFLMLSPSGLAQWSPWTEQSSGLPEGYVVAVIHAVNANVVWGIGWNASGPSQHVVRTTDGGTTWGSSTIAPASTDFNVGGIFAFDDLRAWVAMLNTRSLSVSGGLYATTDGGATWQKDAVAFTTSGGAGCFVHFFDSDDGVAVGNPTDGYFEIYITSNGGTSWSRVPKESVPAPYSQPEILQAGEYAATANCLWFPTYPMQGTGRSIRTTDRGRTWSAHVFPQTAGDWWAPVLAFQDDSVGLGQASHAGVMKTTDGGTTWNLIPNTKWLSFGHLSLRSVPGSPGMYVGTSAFNGERPASEYIWGTVMTLDGGATWTRIGETGGEYSSLAFPSGLVGWRTHVADQNLDKFAILSGRFIGASPHSLQYSITAAEAGTAAETLAVDLANYGTDPISVTSILPPGPNFEIVQQPTLPLTLTTLQSARLAMTFTPHTGGTLHDSVVVVSDASNALRTLVDLAGLGFEAKPAVPGVLYAASGSLFSIDPSNRSTSRIDTLGGIPIHGLAVRSSTREIYGASAVGGTTTLFRISSADAMKLPVRTFPVANMRAIAFSPGDVLYGATTTGDLYRLDIATGEATYVGYAETASYMGLTFSPRGTLWASAYGGGAYDNIFKVDLNTGEPTLIGRTGGNVHTPSIAFSPDGVLYGLTGAGTDTNSIISIDTLTGSGTMLFSTGVQGMMAIAISDVIVSVENQPGVGVPRVYVLEQNYPNPFNPSTTIRYGLPSRSHVTLSVFNTLGQLVAVIQEGEQEAGFHEAVFDASGLASGVYLYRLRAGDFVQSRKLLLLR